MKKIIYDPNNPLSEAAVVELGNQDLDAMFDYLDQKSKYLASNSKKLGTFHMKRYAALTAAYEGRGLTEEEYKYAVENGNLNDKDNLDTLLRKNNTNTNNE